jgi:hypothetical protein
MRWVIVVGRRMLDETFGSAEAARNWARFAYLPEGSYRICQFST